MNYLYGKLNKEIEHIRYSGEDTPTINISIDDEKNIIKADVVKVPNALSIIDHVSGLNHRFDGSHETAIDIPKYELVQEADPQDNLLVYDFKLNGEVLSKITIPFDKDIFNIELKFCEQDGVPLADLHVGDPYLEITVEDGKGSSEKKYISLVWFLYIAGDGIKIENNVISLDREKISFYRIDNVEANFQYRSDNDIYKYKAEIPLAQLTSDKQVPSVYFSKEQIASKKFAPYCETLHQEAQEAGPVNPLVDGDIINALYFDTAAVPDFSLFDWDNPDKSDVVEGISVKDIIAFKSRGYKVIVMQQNTCVGGHKLDLIWCGDYLIYAYCATITTPRELFGDYQEFNEWGWQRDRFTFGGEIVISDIKLQNIWGKYISKDGKWLQEQVGGNVLRLYSKEIGKETIPTIILQ